MTPQRRGSKRGSGWKPPRDRREVLIAVLAAFAVVVVTAALIWFLRPNRDSGSTTTSETTPTLATPTTVTPTTLAGDTTTTAPASTSTP
jgi:hypothetical protein